MRVFCADVDGLVPRWRFREHGEQSQLQRTDRCEQQRIATASEFRLKVHFVFLNSDQEFPNEPAAMRACQIRAVTLSPTLSLRAKA
jgi:hypothetical protein